MHLPHATQAGLPYKNKLSAHATPQYTVATPWVIFFKI